MAFEKLNRNNALNVIIHKPLSEWFLKGQEQLKTAANTCPEAEHGLIHEYCFCFCLFYHVSVFFHSNPYVGKLAHGGIAPIRTMPRTSVTGPATLLKSLKAKPLPHTLRLHNWFVLVRHHFLQAKNWNSMWLFHHESFDSSEQSWSTKEDQAVNDVLQAVNDVVRGYRWQHVEKPDVGEINQSIKRTLPVARCYSVSISCINLCIKPGLL